jgi:hypothetical protein
MFSKIGEFISTAINFVSDTISSHSGSSDSGGASIPLSATTEAKSDPSSDMWSAWGTAAPGQIAAEASNISVCQGNSLTTTTFGSVDSYTSGSSFGGIDGDSSW